MARTKTKAEEDELEARTQDALAAVLASGVLSNGYPKFSLRAAAKHYNISPSRLTARYNHRKTRNESHKAQQKLTPAQENVLKDWIKSMGRRGVPLSLQAIAEYASVITKEDVGVGWARKFRLRHPDLKARWTTGLEKCRAQCLNRPLVTEYFAMLGELIEEYGIPPENIYNMDEKGIQMGLGKRTLVLVDRDQSMVYHVEDGNRELVTIIEAICADGSSLWPSVIYKGATRDLQWGRNNPAKASISFSPKGWTDNELGLKWLEKDFEPQTAARNISGGWRLLILDGHNSHCTYAFCAYAARHRILILCLVAHTTHRCQPCDVGVFGPLASAWKAEVMKTARAYVRITKYNLLEHYHNARERAFGRETIQAAFRKTGIWPYNPNVIEDEAYEPALNTTTRSAQPVPAALPALLAPAPAEPTAPDAILDTPSPTTPRVSRAPSEASGSQSATTRTPESASILSSSTAQYTPIGLPKVLPPRSSRKALTDQNDELFKWATLAAEQMEADYASKALMDAENERLRQQLFAKKDKPKKLHVGGAGARHMTNDETLDALAKVDWEASIKLVHAEASKRFAEIRAAWEAAVKQRLEERKRLEKEALQAAKAAERVEKEAALEIEKARKAAEKAEAKKLVDAAKVVEKARKKELADAAKAAEKERKKKLAEEEKARAKVAEAEARSRGELPAPKAPTKKKGGSAKQGQKRAQVDEDVDPANKENTPIQPAPKRPHPKPRPIGRPPGSSGALAAVQVSSSINAPVDDALAMIDPVLRPGA